MGKKMFRQRRFLAGVLAAVMIMQGSAADGAELSGTWKQDVSVEGRTGDDGFADIEEVTEGDGISDEMIPRVTRTQKVFKLVKKIKLEKKAKETYTEEGDVQKQTTTSMKVSHNETVTVTTETSTKITNSYEKGSKINTQTTDMIVVTTISIQPVQKPMLESKKVEISSIAPQIDRRVSDAFTALGFEIYINSESACSGLCNVKDKKIILRKEGDIIYHELGHFVAFLVGNVDISEDFVGIYEQEKNIYSEADGVYSLQNSSEYFAEAFKNYTLDPYALKKLRPKTYKAVKKALNKITKKQIKKIKEFYNLTWEDDGVWTDR